MIPKVIHYCWFSGEKYPPLIKKCISSWKRFLPEYTFQLWHADNIELETEYAINAFNKKKWAFLTDYVRMKVLYDNGGIFLDTDVLLIKPFYENLLEYSSFWNFADNGMIEPVVIGAEKANPIVRKCKEYYETLAVDEINNFIEIPKVITPIFNKMGLKKYNFNNQIINNNIILSHNAFCPMPFNKASVKTYHEYVTKETIAIHMWNAAWIDDEFRFFWNNRWSKGWKIVLKKIIKNPFRSLRYYKDLLYHLSRQLKIKKV